MYPINAYSTVYTTLLRYVVFVTTATRGAGVLVYRIMPHSIKTDPAHSPAALAKHFTAELHVPGRQPGPAHWPRHAALDPRWGLPAGSGHGSDVPR